jgi:antitoxin component of MazEF toxin-antitoxin module
MKVKLREVNGSCYILIKKEVKEMLLIDNEVDVTIENNKIVISPIKKEKEV